MATRSIARIYDAGLAPVGLRAASYSILARLGDEGPFAVGDLAARLALERTTLTRELRPLLEDGLVEITVGEDRRRRIVALTPAGDALLRRARPHWQDVQDRVVTTFGDDSTGVLLRGLRGLLAAGRSLSDAEPARA